MECDLFKKPHLLGSYRIGPKRSLILFKKKKRNTVVKILALMEYIV